MILSGYFDRRGFCRNTFLVVVYALILCALSQGRGEDPEETTTTTHTDVEKSTYLPLGTIVSIPSSSSTTDLTNIQLSVVDGETGTRFEASEDSAQSILQAIGRAVSSLRTSQNGAKKDESMFGYVDGLRPDGTYDIQIFDGSYATAVDRNSVMSAEQQIDHLPGGAGGLSPDGLTPAQAEFLVQVLDLFGIPREIDSDAGIENDRLDARKRQMTADLRRRCRRRHLANSVFASSLSTKVAVGDGEETTPFFGHRDAFDGDVLSSMFYRISAFVMGDKVNASSLEEAFLNTIKDAASTSDRVDVAEAHRELGKMYLHGTDDVGRDSTKALAHLQTAAQLGDAPAQRILALLPSSRRTRVKEEEEEEEEDRDDGSTEIAPKRARHVPKSRASAAGRSIARLYFASMGGDLHATMALGYRHMYGIEVPKRCSAALQYYRAAARKVVEPLWLEDLGFMSTQDHFKLLHRRISNWKVFSMPIDSGEYDYLALTGDTDVQVSVARLLMGGAPSMGMSSDVDGAQEWLESAATMGNTKAAALLGRLLLQKAKRASARGDDDEDIYRKGALQLLAYVVKRTTPHVQFSATTDVLTGIDRVFRAEGWGEEALPPSNWEVPSSPMRDLEGDHMSSAVPGDGDTNDESNDVRVSDDQTRAEALRVVGAAFLYGRSGFARDRDIATSALREASLLKNPEAMFDLAIVRLSGYGAPRSLRQALRHVREAAGAKHKMAQYVWAEMRALGLSADANSCRSIVSTLKTIAEDNAFTVEALFEARRRYLSGDAEGALSVYLQLAGTGVGVAQANAANILTRPSTAAPIGMLVADALHWLARPVLSAIFGNGKATSDVVASHPSSDLGLTAFVEAPELVQSTVSSPSDNKDVTRRRPRSFAEHLAVSRRLSHDSMSTTARVDAANAARTLAIDLYERARLQGWSKAQRFLCDLRHEHRIATRRELLVEDNDVYDAKATEEDEGSERDDVRRRILDEIHRRSFECYSRAAKSRDHEAAFRVGQLLALGIGTSRDLHGAAGMFHKAFQYARMVGERNSVVPVNLALAAIRLQVALENLAGSRSLKEIEEALARELTRATTKDQDGKVLKIGDAIRSRWLGGQRWWRGKVQAINQDGTIDVAYDDGDFETSVDASKFVSKSDESKVSSSSSDDDGAALSIAQITIVCPTLDALALFGLSNPQGCDMLTSLPVTERDDLSMLVLVSLCFVVAIAARFLAGFLDRRRRQAQR